MKQQQLNSIWDSIDAQKEAQIGKAMVNKFGFGCWPNEALEYEKELRKNYKDWWEK